VLTRAAQNGVPDWDSVYYIVEISNTQELSQFIDTSPSAVLDRSMLIEFNDYTHNWSSEDLSNDIDKVHNPPLLSRAGKR
jgi:hypothetical protein